jgi:hypothetical protein
MEDKDIKKIQRKMRFKLERTQSDYAIFWSEFKTFIFLNNLEDIWLTKLIEGVSENPNVAKRIADNYEELSVIEWDSPKAAPTIKFQVFHLWKIWL